MDISLKLTNLLSCILQYNMNNGIQSLPPEVIALIGSSLDSIDRRACHLAAKCFHSVSHGTRNHTIYIDSNNMADGHSENLAKITSILKRRSPLLNTVCCTIRDMDDYDARPIICAFRDVFPYVRFKLTVQRCKQSDRIISRFPDGTEVYMRQIHPSSSPLDVSIMLGKKYIYIFMTRIFEQLLQCKEFMDNVQSLEIVWNEKADLTNVDPQKTRVTLMYNGCYNLHSFEHKDLWKAQKIVVHNTMASSFDVLTSMLKSSIDDYKKKACLTCVDFFSQSKFSMHNLGSFVDILPRSCVVRVSNISCITSVYLLEVLADYNVVADLCVQCRFDQRAAYAVNFITKRNHRIIIKSDFFEPSSYKSLAEVWAHMTPDERCEWGLIKHIIDIHATSYSSQTLDLADKHSCDC